MVFPLVLSLRKHKSCFASKIKLLSPAKINLYLNILGRYPGGFHRIESIVERVSLFDEITIEVTKEPKINISSNNKSLESKTNLCLKAAHLLKKKFKIPFGFNIYLKKIIPIGSGLGGGSSNAASTLIGIKTLLGLKLNKQDLYKLGSQLGSDVNFFLCQSKYAILSGRGQKVIPFEGKKMRHLIIWPGKSLSTKKVYDKTKVKLTNFFNSANMVQYAIRRGDIPLLQKGIFNVLEASALSLYRELARIKQRLNDNGIFCKVTGSGSSFYTILNNISAKKVKKLLPEKWVVFKVQTF